MKIKDIINQLLALEQEQEFDDIEQNLYLVIGSYNFTNISGLLQKVVFKEIIAADSMSANSLLDELCKKFHDDLSSKNGFMTIDTIIKL